MPQSPTPQPNFWEPLEPTQPRGSEARGARPVAVLSISKYLSALAACSDGSVSADVALDLVLNEILKRACLALNATAGAVALADKSEMVCRATTGENAPDLGVRLDTSHGLSGACVTTREWQRCNDSESDSRVNAALCRHLGVRSILVVPVLSGAELIGIVEIFSPVANAFSDADAKSLQAFSEEVVENVERAAGARASQAPPAAPEPIPVASAPEPTKEESTIAAMEPITKQEAEPGKEFWTTALLGCVVLLAVLVGWMLGRVEWRHRSGKAPAAPTQAAHAQSDSSGNEPSGAQLQSASAPQAKAISTSASTDGGLVITRDGKVVFRTPPQHSEKPASVASQQSSGALRLSPRVAEKYLVTRIEPDYPEQARKDQVQGSVIIDALVGKDGAVQKVTSESGNPELVPAATQAVRQWRFRPFLEKGQPQEFSTTITVTFRLP
jgi:TonB family protein